MQLDHKDVNTSLGKISATLSSIEEKIGELKGDFDKMSYRLEKSNNEIISHRKDIESNSVKLSELSSSLKEFKERSVSELKLCRKEAVSESSNKIKLWFLSAVIPGALSLLLYIVPTVINSLK